MEAQILREQLFAKYFEEQNGVLLTDLVEKLSLIRETWEKLHLLFEKNITSFGPLSRLEKIKAIKHKEKKYLIIKQRMFRYVIIDLEKHKSLTTKEFRKQFDEEFFINNFDESELPDGINNILYYVEKYKGNIKELEDFFVEQQSILNLPTKVYYRLEIGEAWTYFSIDFVNGHAQLGFQTKDQFLYEQIYFRYDLSPSLMQDAESRIGIERMQEIFEQVKKIKIPKDKIPETLYKEYLKQSNKVQEKLKLEKYKKE